MASTSRATQPKSAPATGASSEPDWIASQLSLATSDLLEIADRPPQPRAATTRSSAPAHLARLTSATLPVSPSLGSLLGEEGKRSARLTPVHDEDGEGKGGEGIKILVQGEARNGSTGAAVGKATSGSDDEEDDHLPAARLSHLIASVRPGSSSPAPRSTRTPTHHDEDDDHDDAYDPPPFLTPHHSAHLHVPSSTSSSGDSALRRPKSPLDDGVWLNSKGERVVNGQVVGRLSLVRPSAKRGGVDLEERQTETEESGRDGELGRQMESSKDSEAIRKSESSTVSAGTQMDAADAPGQSSRKRGDPPAFFLQHFPAPPSLSSLGRERSESGAEKDEVQFNAKETEVEATDGIKQDDEDGAQEKADEAPTTSNPAAPSPSNAATLLAEAQAFPSSASPDSRGKDFPSSSGLARPRQPSALLGPSTAAPAIAEVQRSTTEPVKLHGNRRAAELAATGAGVVDQGDAGPSRSSSRKSASASRSASASASSRPANKDKSLPRTQPATSSTLHEERPIPFLARAAGLFNAGLVPSREEERGTATSSRPSKIRTRGWADEGVGEGRRGGVDVGEERDAGLEEGRGGTPDDAGLNGAGLGGEGGEVAEDDDGDGDDDSLISLPVSTYTASSAAPSSFSGGGVGSRRLSRSNSARSGRSSISSGGGGGGGPNASARRPGHARRRSSAGSASVSSAFNLGGAEGEDEALNVDAGTLESGGRKQRPTPPPPLFREVKIRGWNLVGDKRKGWICFSVVLVTAQGTSMTLHRRYSSFVALRDSLVSELSQRHSQASSSSSRSSSSSSSHTAAKLVNVPSLPPRHSGVGGALGIGIGNKEDAKHLERRRTALQKWLQDVMMHRVMGRSESVKGWIVGG